MVLFLLFWIPCSSQRMRILQIRDNLLLLYSVSLKMMVLRTTCAQLASLKYYLHFTNAYVDVSLFLNQELLTPCSVTKVRYMFKDIIMSNRQAEGKFNFVFNYPHYFGPLLEFCCGRPPLKRGFKALKNLFSMGLLLPTEPSYPPPHGDLYIL